MVDPQDNQPEWHAMAMPSVIRRWKSLTDREKVNTWLNANDEDRRAISKAVPDEELRSIRNRVRHMRSQSQRDRPTKPRSSGDSTEDNQESIRDELTKIHREKMEFELERINSRISDYFESAAVRRQKQRTDNIYVLVAVGIITAFITLYPNLSIETSLDLFAAIIALTAGVYIFLKLNLVRVDSTGDDLAGKADWWANALFVLATSGVLIFSLALILVNSFEISLGLELATQSILTLVTLLAATLATTRLMTEFFTITVDEFEDDISIQDIQESLLSLSSEDSDSQEKKISEFVDILHEFKSQSARKSDLEKIKGWVRGVDITQSQINHIVSEINDLIDQLERETKSDEELKEQDIRDLEERREQLWGDLHNSDT